MLTPPRALTTAKPSSSVTSSPQNTGVRPRNGASRMNASMAVPFVKARGLMSKTNLPSTTCQSFVLPSRAAFTASLQAFIDEGLRRQCKATVNFLSSTKTPRCPAANSRSSVRTLRKPLGGGLGRTIVPSAARRSSPCSPATAGMAVPRKPSICSMDRPVTIATASPNVLRNAASNEGRVSGTSTDSGVGAISTMLPSKSRNNAQSMRGSGRFTECMAAPCPESRVSGPCLPRRRAGRRRLRPTSAPR